MSERRSAWATARSVYAVLRASAPTVVEANLGRVSQQTCDRRLSRFAISVLGGSHTSLVVDGRERVEPGVGYVIMSNHLSHYDIPMIYASVPGSIRMVAKKELFRFPVFGPAMRAAGMVEVDRKNKRQAIDSLHGALGQLAAGVSIWIAPEGTRSVTGELGPFKKGGFVLAIEAQAPILPVRIDGTRDVLPRGTLLTRTGRSVHVSIDSPIPTAGLGLDDRDALMERVRARLLPRGDA